MKKKYDKVFHLNPESSPLGIRNVFVRSFVEHLARLDKLNRIVCDGRAVEQRAGQCFSDRILEGMNVKVNISDEDLARIPKTGPVIVVANHPFGGIEGVVLMSVLNRVRPDYKVLVNYILEMVPELRENFIGVDVFGTAAAMKKNIRPLMETMKWVKEGHLLGVFPSGEVSSIDLKSRRVRDPKWQETIGGVIR
ncbi:MAG: glycerol acyltransferase, partial [Kiritimatiellae bacterium]|nr:glycerol acyltransferase [Kiritimatiellia bacterium]